MSEPIEVHIAWSPIVFDCPVPVTPDGETMRDGEPIELEERTEKCGQSAPFIVGAQVTCREHLRMFCEIGDIDFDDVIRDLEEQR